jgi:hypothetical protein
MSEQDAVTVFLCGGSRCADGQPHDGKEWVDFRDEDGKLRGGSAACSRCGSMAMDRDMLELP